MFLNFFITVLPLSSFFIDVIWGCPSKSCEIIVYHRVDTVPVVRLLLVT